MNTKKPAATEEKNNPDAIASDRELIVTRLIHAPRELVWEAWTDPRHLAQWWGPNGFTNTFHEFDLRPGGHWRYTMHGPNGRDFQNECVFVELTKPERIVLQHLSNPKFQITATFVDEGGQTRLTFRQTFATAADCDKVRSFAVPGNEQNMDRLEAHLAKMA